MYFLLDTGSRVLVSAAFRAAAANSLPNGLNSSEALTLTGRSEFEFREGGNLKNHRYQLNLFIFMLHNSLKTTEIYTHVSKKAIDEIQNPADEFFE